MTLQSFDNEYVTRLRDGDPFIEQHFASYFGQLLFLKLRARLRSPQLIEDIRQETLLRVLQTLRRRDGIEHPERFGAYVNAVCNNVLLEFYRADKRHDPMDEKAAEPVDTSVDLDGPLIGWEQRRQIDRVLRELSEKDRDLLRMMYLDQMDKKEICRRFEVDEEYLRVLLHRAKMRFRKVYLQKASTGA